MALTFNYGVLGMYKKGRKSKVGTTITRTYRSGSGVVSTSVTTTKPTKPTKKTTRNKWEVESDWDAENSLRRMEAYGAYLACGCVDGFWEDDTAQGGRW